jgi:deoxyribodipyrimidine photo-lyase
MGSDRPAIVWFRQDLRLADNPALAAAHADSRPVIPLYILDEAPPLRALGGASRWWLDKSLAALAADLEAIGSRLILRRGSALTVLRAMALETGAGSVFWNRVYDGAGVERDTAVKAALRDDGLTCESFNAGLLNEPWAVKTGAGGAFKVFTPYWRAARAMVEDPRAAPRPRTLAAPAEWPRSEPLASWRLHPTRPDWSGGFADWAPGEAGATARLQAFLEGPIGDYAEGRDFPARTACSRLSPHLRLGEIGPRQVWGAAQAAAARGAAGEGQVEAFLRELGWREFNQQLLFHHPRIISENFSGGLDDFPWRRDPGALADWQRGQTGYPIVDAGLRELWATGWMHNRVRMIVASFLIKHLLIDWREGEAWFWDTLVDADLANNVCNWQWVAGCGADAAPFFRIFNPILQGERFDAEGDYVRRWVPELARLPAKVIHEPWSAEARTLAAAGVELGKTYPKPIVGHAMARERALNAYKALAE